MALSDAEVIASFCEPKPLLNIDIGATTPWWVLLPGGWFPKPLTLDALHEVEDRLTDQQWHKYEQRFNSDRILNKRCERCGASNLYHHRASSRALLHAAPEQKIQALAAVLRPVVESA